MEDMEGCFWFVVRIGAHRSFRGKGELQYLFDTVLYFIFPVPQWKILSARRRPFCRSPISKVNFPKEGTSSIPLEELPITACIYCNTEK